MSPTIRTARPDDARGIAEAQVASWRSAYREILPASVLDGLTVDARERMWTSVLSGSGASVVVAIDDERVIGFAATCATRDDDLDRTVVGEITAIYVREEHWSTGTGRALFATACGELASLGLTEVAVWVLEANHRGRTFYERMNMRLDDAAETYFEADGHRYREVRYRRPLSA